MFLFSMRELFFAIIAAWALLFVYALGLVVYRKAFHPLAQYPGPWLWSVSRVPWVYHQVSGNLAKAILKIHNQYGEVVRTSPDEISFITPSAWRDIYGPGRTEFFKKDMKVYPRMVENVDSILTADNANHPRHRKLLNYAFSERALRAQEPLFQKYVDQLIHKLRDSIGTESSVDLVKWYNWTTFDIIGHLGFGEPFGCLESKDYHPWVAMIIEHIKGGAYLSASKRYSFLIPIMRRLIPKELIAKRNAQLALTKEKVARRVATDSSDADFLSFILKENNEKGLNRAELEVDASILIIAGSETTATTMSGTTYYLLKYPETLKRLKAEIRSVFVSEEDINFLSVQELRYMNACIKEGLRLFPPIPTGLARILEDRPGGEYVSGCFIPDRTRVSVSQYSAYRSPLNFKDPDSFRPERWLGDPDYAADKRDAVQSFSIGPRNCIGVTMGWAEMRLMLARVVWNFDLELLDDGFNPEQQDVYNFWQKPALNVRLSDASKSRRKA